MEIARQNLENLVKGNRPKIGLALSGGGARGLAHIGVLKEFKKANIPIDFLAGTSMGGLIGAAYAAGIEPEQIEEIARRYSSTRRLMRLMDPTVPRHGLFQGDTLHSFFRNILSELQFSDLRIPLTLVAVDLDTGREVRLCEGNVADAVRSTVSLPGIFAPFERNGSRLVDGGLLNNLPSDVVREMGADQVIAIDVAHEEMNPFWHTLEKKPFVIGTLGGLVAVLGDSLEIMMRQQRDLKLQQCPPDFLLRLPIPPDISVMSGYHRADELIKLGEESAQTLVLEIKTRLHMNE